MKNFIIITIVCITWLTSPRSFGAEEHLQPAEDAKSAVDHFTITHSPSGIYCKPQQIVVSAMDITNHKVENYTGTVSLDSSSGRGDWQLVYGKGELQLLGDNSGKANYTFASSDQGVAIFNLNYVSGSDVIDIEVVDVADIKVRDDDAAGALAFTSPGLLITAKELTPNISSYPEEYNQPILAGEEQTLHLTAFGNNAGSCALGRGYTGVKTLKIWQEYQNPSNGTLTAMINGAAVGSSVEGYTVHDVTFVDGKAEVLLSYADVGKIKLHFADVEEQTIAGATDYFVVKPARFFVSIPQNPVATNHNGNVFRKAGDKFTVHVSAQNLNGEITPNFGNELVAEQVYVTSMLALPVKGRNGTKNDGMVSSPESFYLSQPGIYTSKSVIFDEVGIINLQANLVSGSYLGAGKVNTPKSENVGRFIPDHFAVTGNTPRFMAACQSGQFTYLNQKFKYANSPQLSVVAKNKNNLTTKNYIANFNKLAEKNFTAAYRTNMSALNFRSEHAAKDLKLLRKDDGAYTLRLSDGGGVAFAKKYRQPLAPLHPQVKLEVSVTDDDKVSYPRNPFVYGGLAKDEGIEFVAGNTFYDGRIILKNTAGSEILPLTMPFEAQYYNGKNFVVNVRDNCTALDSERSIILGMKPTDLNTVAHYGGFVNGLGSIILTAPSPQGLQGIVEVKLDLTKNTNNLEHLLEKSNSHLIEARAYFGVTDEWL